MISCENLCHYIEHERGNYYGEKFDKGKFTNGRNIILLDDQKRFLENLVFGKITDCPRCFGKTFLINLYAEYLNKQHDELKFDDEIIADDFITSDEILSKGLLTKKHLANALKQNPTKAKREYNLTDEMIEKLQSI